MLIQARDEWVIGDKGTPSVLEESKETGIEIKTRNADATIVVAYKGEGVTTAFIQLRIGHVTLRIGKRRALYQKLKRVDVLNFQ